MRSLLLALSLLASLAATSALAGDAETKAGRDAIDGQIRAFLAGDDATAYSYAAPNVKRLFPTLETFMAMVTSGYQTVYKPRNYAFGKVRELSTTSIVQQVLVVGPDGRDYEAIYTLEMQPDGNFRITGVSLRASNSLGA